MRPGLFLIICTHAYSTVSYIEIKEKDATGQGDLTYHHASTVAECQTFCDQNENCNSFVFNPKKTKPLTNCYLKQLTLETVITLH